MRQTNINAGHSVAEFAAYKDYIYLNYSTETAQFFWTGGTDTAPGAQLGGSCCVDLAHYYYINPIAGGLSDTTDDLGNFDFVVNQMGFNVITTDDVINWVNQLSALNLGNLNYMQASGYQGDPHCNVGNGQYPGCDSNGTTVHTYCSAEGGICSFSGERVVAFGANGSYNNLTVIGSIACNVSSFPPDDPAPGVVRPATTAPPLVLLEGSLVSQASIAQTRMELATSTGRPLESMLWADITALRQIFRAISIAPSPFLDTMCLRVL